MSDPKIDNYITEMKELPNQVQRPAVKKMVTPVVPSKLPIVTQKLNESKTVNSPKYNPPSQESKPDTREHQKLIEYFNNFCRGQYMG
jgi:hypothetical protein